MDTLEYLKNNCPIRNNQYTPIAYTAASVALATHTHPIQALKYVFASREILYLSSSFDTCQDAVESIIAFYDLPLFGTLGDLSEDFRLVGHLESLSTSLCVLLKDTGMSVDEMNVRFAVNQIWESMSCGGREWVSSGIDWTVGHLKRSVQ